MEANRSPSRWTYAEYARLPLSGTTRHEVIGDQLSVTPSPSNAHQLVVTNLVRILGTFVHDHALGRLLPGPADVLFGEGDYVQPDLLFVQAARLHLMKDHGTEGPPDLIVEILSPSTAKRDRGIKLERYRHFEVGEYWIVDIEARAIEVWRLAQGASAPEVADERAGIRWTPVSGGPTLDARVSEILP